MKKLIASGLMFGNLVHVASPALVDRYNRALKTLTGWQTALADFHVDISGFSPEIGDELGDDLYLNQNGCNRQFILLTTEQKSAPLLGTKFSFTRGLLRRFIDANEAALFALTTQDAVAGEVVDTVFDVSDPRRLWTIRRLSVEADSTELRVAHARELAGKIERFRSEEDAWWDDVLIAEMIGLARTTGDVTSVPLALDTTTEDVGNFWTDHHGGLYIFRDVPHPAVIASGDVAALGDLPSPFIFSLDQHNHIARLLDLNGLAEPIVTAKGVDAAAILRQKMDFILVAAASSRGEDLSGATRRDLRQVARRIGADLPPAYLGLADLVRWAEGAGPWPTITSEHPAYFYTLRAARGADRDIVNQLLAELSPLDIRQLFICHKALFYRLYRDWSEARQVYAVRFLSEEYMIDKTGTRRALFGPEPGMEEPEPPPPPPEPSATPSPEAPQKDMIDLVGPWGAVRRRT
ncbi:DUF6638 family protein [Anianabacter salinae]|uniref:DUF6638 family protein n=1 Tax=Anianabacter salinae TaxID=2851023 RepID=UPI00225DEF8B|nr:DUF6638 family protein [Anianabacter salinae]MBV0913052.1 hypothetical protein [Anianabacter salinae]